MADVIGARREYEYEVHQTAYATGARFVFKRMKLSEFEVRLRLYDSDALIEFDMWRSHLKPPKSRTVVTDGPPKPGQKAVSALDIWHPLLESLDIKSVVVLQVSQLEYSDEFGCWTVTIKFLESRGLPEQTLAKVEGSKAAPLDPVEKATLAQDKEIHRLWEENAR